MKTFKVLLLVMLLMAIASPAKANDINAGTRVSIEAIPLIDNPADPLTVNPYDFVDLIITEENTGDVDLYEVRVDVNENGISMEVLDKFTASGDDGDGVLNPLEVWSWTIRTEIRRDTTFEAFGYGERIDGYIVQYCGPPVVIPEDIPVPGIICDEEEYDSAEVKIASNFDITVKKTCPTVSKVGDDVPYTVTITNTGDARLLIFSVEDSLVGSILPERIELIPTEVYEIEYSYQVLSGDPDPLFNKVEVETVVSGTAEQYANGESQCETDLEIDIPEGCTPGFWKNNADKHDANAWCDRYSPDMRISDVIRELNEPLVIRGKGKKTITDPTLLQALDANGGGVNAMIRHGIAALLNASSECVNYPIKYDNEIAMTIEETLNGFPGGYTVDELHSMLAEYNELGCPLNQHGKCVGVEDENDG